MANLRYVFAVLTMLVCRSSSMTYDQLSDCDNTINCFKEDTCTTFATCSGIAMYYFNPNDNMFYITLATSNLWVGFGQNIFPFPTDKMANSKGAYCVKTSDGVVLGFFEGKNSNTAPTWLAASTIKDAMVISTMEDNGVITCKFKRPLNITDTESIRVMFDYDKTNLGNIMAFGTQLGGNFPGYHQQPNTYAATNSVADWKNKSSSLDSNVTTTPKPATAVMTQGSFSILSLMASFVLVVFIAQ